MPIRRRRPVSVFASVVSCAVVAAASLGASSVVGAQATPASPAVVEFMKRVESYAALHRKLESTVPKLPDEATPVQIDQSQRALFAQVKAARAGARQGDLFTPAMTAYVKDLLRGMFDGEGGQRLRASLMDENVKELALTVNQRFPDEIPLATMPPRLLKALPELPEQMEFRFVASNFVLLDSHAHLVVDFIPAALPPKARP